MGIVDYIINTSKLSTMPKVTFKGTVIAESDTVEKFEGNLYFPPDSLNMDFFIPTDKTTHCGWKGMASYYTIMVDDEEAVNAAWYYPEPYEAATNITGHVAFYK